MNHSFDIVSFLDWVVNTWAPVRKQADAAAYSRSHFSDRFSRTFGESPRALKTRLQMEAGAFLLSNTNLQVGDVAVEVGYASPEAFNKAFKRAFGVPPTTHRTNPAFGWIDSPSGIHFHPHGLIVRKEGANYMKISTFLMQHHIEEISRLLELAKELGTEILDQESPVIFNAVPWDKHPNTVRALLNRLVFTDAVWSAALNGEPFPEMSLAASIAELTQLHNTSRARVAAFFERVETEGLWESEFVDALCSPPETFRFDGVFADIIEFSAVRRSQVLAALASFGISDGDYGDPIHWQRGIRGAAVRESMGCG